MRLPVLRGLIRRRILVNYRVDPEVIRRLLPAPLEPKLVGEFAFAGICLIRLEGIRPKGFPAFVGVTSENAAHRIAVTWEKDGQVHEGVYIPRRDSSSLVNFLAGGRLFPGEHHRAEFNIRDHAEGIEFAMRAADDSTVVELKGKESNMLPAACSFKSIEEASRFFQEGSLGYSETKKGTCLDGVTLATENWKVTPLDITHVHSSFFANAATFAPGSATFDCALLMRNIEHEWHSAPSLAVRGNAAAA
jgi:hypothetical protein